MAFAPFPAAGYLADGSRTEGEMKTAFENWLLATKQTADHGSGALTVASPTLLRLDRRDGKQMLVGERSIEIPSAGLTITNAGAVANAAYWVCLTDFSDDGVGALRIIGEGAPGYSLGTALTTGVRVVIGEPGDRNTYLGRIKADASAQFVAGTLTPYFHAPPAVRAWAAVAAAGSFYSSVGFSSVTRTAVGVYSLVLTPTLASASPCVTPYGGTPAVATASHSGDTITVRTFTLASAAIDVIFYIQVAGAP